MTLSWWDSVSLRLWEGCDQKTPEKKYLWVFFFLIFFTVYSLFCLESVGQFSSIHTRVDLSEILLISRVNFAAAFRLAALFSPVLAPGNSAWVP